MPQQRRRLITAMVLVFAALFSSCATDDDAAVPAPAPAPVPGGTVEFMQIPPNTLDPAIIVDSFAATIVNLMHSGLLRHDRNFGIRPDVARTWRIEESGRLYFFEMRDDVVFHDGRPVRAQDVEHSIQRVFDLDADDSELARHYLQVIEGVDEYLRGEADRIVGVTVQDDLRLTIRLERPYAPFLNVLASEFARIVPRPEDPDAPTDVTIGCGPFALKAHVPGERLELRRHEDFHREVLLDGVVVRTPEHHSTQQAIDAFTAGELDLVELTTATTDRLDPVLGARIHRRLELSLTFLGFTTDRPPFDDPDLRRAIAHAIDVKALHGIDAVRKPVATGVLPPGFPGYQPHDKRLAYDPARAAELVAKAASIEAPLRIAVPKRGDAFDQMAEDVCTQIRALGLPVELLILPWAEFSRGVRRDEFDGYFLTWVADVPDADSFFFPLFHSTGSINYLHYENADVDAWLDEARGENVQTRRLELYRRAESQVLGDAAIVPLHFNSTVIAVQGAVRGFEVTSMGSAHLRLENVWLEPDAERSAR